MKRQISAQSKKQNKITEHDAECARKRALWHYHKPTEAELNFWDLYSSMSKQRKSNNIISKKHSDFIIALDQKYMILQNEIENKNIDPSFQQSLINQQSDIIEEQEIIYKKYLKK